MTNLKMEHWSSKQVCFRGYKILLLLTVVATVSPSNPSPCISQTIDTTCTCLSPPPPPPPPPPIFPCYKDPLDEQRLLVIAGCVVAMLLIVLVFVGGFIYSKKCADGSAAPDIQTSGNLPDDETPHTTKPTLTSGDEYMELNFDQSDFRNAVSDVPEVHHTHMAMKCKSPASTSRPITSDSVDDHGDAVHKVRPTLVRKQVQAHSNLKEEPTYVNTEGASTY
eukprot:XP_011668628.1 PREDICTED: uncharacterized protein LOC105440281 isoform X2 [Strongylocentrotus purpuratus]